ncbi:MAG: TetR/AcrR family transcriptional regulator [Roseiflexaceae bacterium]
MEQRAGRQNQKQRTRNAIVATARDLVSQGKVPSVAEVAEAALVSPATAYRYFPDQLSLLRAALQEALPRDEEIATPIHDETADVAERVAHATTAFLRLTLKRESLVRAVMALSLLQSVEAPANRQEAVALRPGYRLVWIAQALAPLEGRIDADALRRLRNALAVVVSSEALIALQDVSGLDAEEAVDICAWAARTLVQAAVSNHTGEADRKGD